MFLELMKTLIPLDNIAFIEKYDDYTIVHFKRGYESVEYEISFDEFTQKLKEITQVSGLKSDK